MTCYQLSDSDIRAIVLEFETIDRDLVCKWKKKERMKQKYHAELRANSWGLILAITVDCGEGEKLIGQGRDRSLRSH